MLTLSLSSASKGQCNYILAENLYLGPSNMRHGLALQLLYILYEPPLSLLLGLLYVCRLQIPLSH